MNALVKILIPLSIPLISAAAGGVAGYFTFTKYRELRLKRGPMLWGLIVLSALSAFIPNVGQQLYILGMSLPATEIAERASYFVFGFAAVGAWQLLARRWIRAVLLLLIPICFAQPLI